MSSAIHSDGGAWPAGRWSRLVPGLALSAAIAVCAARVGDLPWMQAHGLGVLTIAIVAGALIGNTVYPAFAAASGPGVTFSKQSLLRAGVVLYGLRLTGQDVARLGIAGIGLDAVIVLLTLVLAVYLGTRWLRLDRKTALLIGVGHSICGAAAVMAAEPVVRARADQVAVAIATVVVFGSLAMFFYPVLYDLNRHWHVIDGGARGFGVYTGATVHEVAQAIAAARPIGPEAADSAVIAKMIRIMMLAPVLLGVSWWSSRQGRGRRHDAVAGGAHRPGPGAIAIPWFALVFIGAVAFNSLQWLPPSATSLITQADSLLLAAAMASLGLTTHVSAVRKAGMKPLLLACALFAWLVIGGALIDHALFSWLA